MFFVPAGTMQLNGTFTQILCQFLNLHVDGPVSEKFDTG